MEGTTEREEREAFKQSGIKRGIYRGDYFRDLRSGGECWNGVENGGERESDFQKGAPQGFHGLATS